MKQTEQLQSEYKTLGTDKMPNLYQDISDKLGDLEKKYKQWKNEQVIEWIKIIENRKFNDDKYSNFIQQIQKMELTGVDLKGVSEIVLKMLGLDEIDRKILLENIHRVLHKYGDKRNDICTVCVQNRINSIFTPCGHMVACFDCYQAAKDELGTFNPKNCIFALLHFCIY